MKSPSLVFGFVVLVCTTLPGASVTAQARSAGQYATITGAVIDSIHRGYLGGALVTVTGTSRSATTDSAGRFTIDSIPPGDGIAVQVFHLPRRSAFAAGPTKRGPASLTGIVVDAKGDPLPDASASIDADGRTTRTGVDGTFTLSELRSGTRRLTVRRPGMVPVHAAVDLSAARVEHITVKMIWPITSSKR